MTLLPGYPIYKTSFLPDGEVMWVDDGTFRSTYVFVGTRRLTDVEFAGLEGRYMVRQGMADVLAWLGEEVGPPPLREGRGEAILERLRSHGD